MSGNTRAGILRLASAVFSFGVSRGYRTDSPITYLAPQERPEPKPSTKAGALTDGECSRLIAATRPGLRDFVSLLALTGVRLSEGLGLRWADVEEATITVNAQLDGWKQGQAPKLKGLKTENGYRRCGRLRNRLPCDLTRDHHVRAVAVRTHVRFLRYVHRTLMVLFSLPGAGSTPRTSGSTKRSSTPSLTNSESRSRTSTSLPGSPYLPEVITRTGVGRIQTMTPLTMRTTIPIAEMR
jgi:hypothetical protein